MDRVYLQSVLDELHRCFPDLSRASLNLDPVRPLWNELTDDYAPGMYYERGRATTEALVWLDPNLVTTTGLYTVAEDGTKKHRSIPAATLGPQDTWVMCHRLVHEFSHHLDVERNSRDCEADRREGADHNEQWQEAYRTVIAACRDASFLEEKDAVIDSCEKDLQARIPQHAEGDSDQG